MTSINSKLDPKDDIKFIITLLVILFIIILTAVNN